jgi:hypothetical protein
MSARRHALADLPDWPLWMTRDEAARYVGVSADVFDLEVGWGHWPPGRARGLKGGKLTWCKLDLDAASRPNIPADDDYEARRNAHEANRQQPAARNKGRHQAQSRRDA